MKFKDYYKVLGVESGASQDEIKRAYRKLARKYHPDVSKEADAEERFKEVGEAYEALKDPDKRKAYDQVRQGGWQQGDEFRPPPDWQGGFQGGGFNPEDLAGFSDFFSSLFGGGFGGGRSRGPRQAPGRDSHARIEVDLETAFKGGARRISLARAVVGADGHVHQRPQDLEVRIPAGVSDGQQIRLRGQGEPGFGGGPAGDLYLEVALKPHRLFEVHGRDIHLQLPIAPWEAALGAKITVPTLAGKVTMNIPPGSSSGKRLRLKGRGLPGKSPGDQYVILKVVVPPADDERQVELYRELERAQNFDPRAGMEV
ncbi:DnaJ C-terminal domain-containing protein [Wenzhouxiangella marina]|uniref:DnaJ-class molecular chaperone CbpA n=1 Tax=Wenzhouxiangella marina TaxID=1579979 RepID=A0A0K0XVB2_9GAMM|nr:DnaJ C-terminal domain-containing protein [Wenzhouxiangella marina]AKS41618.1 DnaJ-class molecular chaperone CbpA [Wenzhouxiangella marina]MBB6086623.1 curved DNA-binding protein [Wenzhouxiangella marina]